MTGTLAFDEDLGSRILGFTVVGLGVQVLRGLTWFDSVVYKVL